MEFSRLEGKEDGFSGLDEMGRYILQVKENPKDGVVGCLT